MSLTISATSLFSSRRGTSVVHDFIIVLQFDTICSWPSVPTHAENINTVIFHLPHNLSWFFRLAALDVHARILYVTWSSRYFKVWAPCWDGIGLTLVAQIPLGLSTNPRNWGGCYHGDKVKAQPVIFLKRKVVSLASSSHAWRIRREISVLPLSLIHPALVDLLGASTILLI